MTHHEPVSPTHETPILAQQNARLLHAAKRLGEDSLLFANPKGLTARLFLLSPAQEPEAKVIGFQTTLKPSLPLTWVAAVRRSEYSMQKGSHHFFATLEDAVDNLMDLGFTLLYGYEETSLKILATRTETLGAIRSMSEDGQKRFAFGHRDMRTAVLYGHVPDEILVCGIGNVAKFRDIESALAYLQKYDFNNMIKIGLEERLRKSGLHPDDPDETLPLLPEDAPEAGLPEEIEEKVASSQHLGFDVGGLQLIDALRHEMAIGTPLYPGGVRAIGSKDSLLANEKPKLRKPKE